MASTRKNRVVQLTLEPKVVLSGADAPECKLNFLQWLVEQAKAAAIDRQREAA